ncbi:hypothetical protein ACFQ4K_23310 [Tistrella bauzanensis]
MSPAPTTDAPVTDAPATDATGRLSLWLRDRSEPDWSAAVAHRFTGELIAGTVADDVMRRYLIQDHRFVDSFVALLGRRSRQPTGSMRVFRSPASRRWSPATRTTISCAHSMRWA